MSILNLGDEGSIPVDPYEGTIYRDLATASERLDLLAVLTADTPETAVAACDAIREVDAARQALADARSKLVTIAANYNEHLAAKYLRS